MLKLLERNIASIEERLVLLAPPRIDADRGFRNVDANPDRHAEFVEALQALRGQIYLQDGAIGPAQLTNGRLHQTPEDAKSWHLLIVDRQRRVSACAWYLEHDNRSALQALRVRNCPLAKVPGVRHQFRAAVESELARARRENLRYAEVGGWAVSKDSRCTSEGLLLALAAYSLGRLAGGALGLTTATVRHSSSAILRRLGGTHLEADGVTVPAYYDSRYDCEMELLRFDSRRPSPKFMPLIDALSTKLSRVLVVAADDSLLAHSFEQVEAPAAVSQYAA
jgi:hypothetical protein